MDWKRIFQSAYVAMRNLIKTNQTPQKKFDRVEWLDDEIIKLVWRDLELFKAWNNEYDERRADLIIQEEVMSASGALSYQVN